MDLRTNIDLKQLRYFVAVVDAGSISRASKLHHIAQPALSKRIGQLEYDLGAPLLHRGHTGVQPTEQGWMLYRAAQRVLRDMASVVEAVHAAESDPVGDVRIGCLQSLTALVGAPLAVRVIEEFPRVRLSVLGGQSLEIYRALVDGLLDVALCVWDEEAPHLEVELQIQEEFFLAASPDMPGLPKEAVIDPKRLKRFPFVFPTARTYASGPVIVGQLQEMGIELNVIAEIDGDGIKSLIAGGHGCCILTLSTIQSEVAAGRIVLKRLRNTPIWRTLALCTAKDRPLSLAARAVTQQMKKVIEDQIRTGAWRNVQIAAGRPNLSTDGIPVSPTGITPASATMGQARRD
ncbi:MAG: LysR family transcriptional regulator [Hyphomonadaceae bacterium]|nr:LysR family transcriptional regulator [Hyphomonadaceae bacterium]